MVRVIRPLSLAVSGLMSIFAVTADTTAGPAASNPAAILAAAHAAYMQRDFATEAKLLRPLADQGDATAQALLGFMCGHGQGVPQDYGEVLEWYWKAAGHG